jgi:plastocyanin
MREKLSLFVATILLADGVVSFALEQDKTTPLDHTNATMLAMMGDTPVAPAKRNAAASRRRPTTYKAVDVKESGTISGTIRYTSAVPAPRKIQVVKDHATCDNRPKEEALIKVDAKGLLAEAVVYLADIKEGKDFDKSAKAPLIDQRVCTFEPHVQAVRAGAPVDIQNSDPVAHNIQANQRVYTLFNVLQPQQNMRSAQKFDKPGIVDIKCNVHDWMRAYVHVFLHPYHQVTGNDGAFQLDTVSPGKYELVVWQEYLGEQSFEVEVKAGATANLDIVLEPKASDTSGK